jgi:crotonobetaine/carnitine-CoA ligase
LKPSGDPSSSTRPAPATLGDDGLAGLLRARAARDPDGVHTRINGVPLTFGTLDRRASGCAAALRARGIEPGDHVAVMLRNGAANLAVIFGLAKAGIVWVPINVRQRGDGLAYLLHHSQPKLLVVEADLAGVVDEALGPDAQLKMLVNGDDEFAPLAAALRSGHVYDAPVPDPEATAAIMYTSGTTGPPKGVIVSHRMMRLAAEAVARVSIARPNDVFFVWEALYHIGGAQLLLLPMTHGIQLAMVERFSASQFWEQVHAEGATHIHYLGGILQILLKQPPGPHDHSHRVRIAWGGGCPPHIWRQFEARFGVKIHECYGMTETSSIATINISGVVGSVGKALPWFSVELCDADGRSGADHARGEIVVRTTIPGAIFSGYFRDPEATAKALRGGALYTGDLGSWDRDGNLVYHGRMTGSVRCRGENVSAWEVEHVADTHPAIEDCAMIGVAADIGEQEIKLFVKPRKGFRVDPGELSSWLSTRLASYQNPRYICVVDEFQRTASQRIIKRTLAATSDDCWDRDAVNRLL